jgi:phosphoribosylformylglycinamidine synthase
MAMASGLGAKLDPAPEDVAAHAYWFGEDQARYLVTVSAAQAESLMAKARDASVLATQIGVVAGDTLAITGERAVSVAKLRDGFEGWLPAYMAGEVAPTA